MGWEMATKGIPIVGSGIAVVIAPAINACAVAVIYQISITDFVNLIQISYYVSVSGMLPVLFTFAGKSVSSFGIFLALGFLVGVFLTWRLARAWDFDEEKILDLILLAFLGGLIVSRLYFVSENIELFSPNLLRIFLVSKYPGFSFWGAILGGWLTLYFVARIRKQDFWQIGDIAAVGFLGGLILADLGCFLGSCNVGIQSNLFFAVNMVGVVGKRLPTQTIEAGLLFLALLSIWSTAIHFHQRGKILSLTLIYIGIIKFLMGPLSQAQGEGIFLSLVLFCLGMTILYKVTKRNPISDVKEFFRFLFKLISDPLTRQSALTKLNKYFFNQKASVSWKARNLKRLLRRFHVRLSYKNN